MQCIFKGFTVHAESDTNSHKASLPVSAAGAELMLGVQLGSCKRQQVQGSGAGGRGAVPGESAEISEDWEEGAEEPVYACASPPAVPAVSPV